MDLPENAIIREMSINLPEPDGSMDLSTLTRLARYRSLVAAVVVALGAFGLAAIVGCSSEPPPPTADDDQNQTDDTDPDNQNQTDDNDTDPEPVDDQCEQGYQLCDDRCVDTDEHPLHCGECGDYCPEGHLCEDGVCVGHDGDCPGTECTGFAYCEAETGVCRPGCFQDDDCPGIQVCNDQTRDCECPQSDQHVCGGVCFDVDDPEACGPDCLVCPSGGGTGTPECVDGQCELICPDETLECDGRCADCPAGAEETTCHDGECIASECPADQVVCDGQCAECPPEATATSCEGAKCVATDCQGNMEPCDGQCAECPSEATSTTCQGGECVAADCDSGYRLCAGECTSCPSEATLTTCQDGDCVEDCGFNQELCGQDDICTDLNSSDEHCGSCDNACADYERCESGECTASHIYTGSSEGWVRKHDQSGETLWSFDGDDGRINRIEVDPDGYVYALSGGGTLWRFEPDGTVDWSEQVGEGGRAMAIDEDRNVYVASRFFDDSTSTANGYLHKFDDSGTEQWKDEYDWFMRHLTVDRGGTLYSGRSHQWLRAHDTTDGDVMWDEDNFSDFQHGMFTSSALAGGKDGELFAIKSSPVTRRDGTDGSREWDEPYVSFRDSVAIALTAGADIIALYNEGEIYKFGKMSGTELAAEELSGFHDESGGLATDPAGNVYAGAEQTIYRFDPFLNEEWSEQVLEGDDEITDLSSDPGLYGSFPDAWE